MGRKRGVQYRGTDFFRTDDRSGFVRRASRTSEEWTGAIVANDLWEPRQPQDLVRGIADDQTVPQPRSEPPAVFNGIVVTTLSQAAAVGATFLYLDNIGTFTNGDKVGVMLDTGNVLNTSVNGAPTALGITILTALTYTAASGNQVTNYGATGP